MKCENGTMTVGAVGKEAEINVDTIRYYEQQGLLPKPSRTRSGYPIFGKATIRRLRFIKNAKTLGFTLS